MKMLSSWAMLLGVAVALHGHRTRADDQCLNPVSRTMEFSLTSHKDKTGRWVAEVEMDDGSATQDFGAWKVDVQQTIVGCPGSPKVKLTARLTAPPPKPGPGYELHRGLGYYKVHADKKTWTEGKTICEAEGGHLVVINSEAESSLLKEMFSRVPANVGGPWLFIGFHDMYTEGQYLTVFDEPIQATGFSPRWRQGQPDNAGGNPGEDCGTIHRDNGGLNDYPCSAPTPFACEIPLPY